MTSAWSAVGPVAPVYFWDLSAGGRIMELEYVDKKCVYHAGERCRQPGSPDLALLLSCMY